MSTCCERSAQVARQLGFSESVAAGIRSLDEHWNGNGRPERREGESIPLGSRFALLAQVADVFYQVAGSFFTTEGVIFYDFHDPSRCLIFELNHENFKREVVEVDLDQDPSMLAAQILSRTG